MAIPLPWQLHADTLNSGASVSRVDLNPYAAASKTFCRYQRCACSSEWIEYHGAFLTV